MNPFLSKLVGATKGLVFWKTRFSARMWSLLFFFFSPRIVFVKGNFECSYLVLSRWAFWTVYKFESFMGELESFTVFSYLVWLSLNIFSSSVFSFASPSFSHFSDTNLAYNIHVSIWMCHVYLCVLIHFWKITDIFLLKNWILWWS